MSETAVKPMSDAELNAIEARANRATKGPWHPVAMTEFVSDAGHMAICRVNQTVSFSPVSMTSRSDGSQSRVPNQDFIASARQDVPALVAEVRRLRAAIAMHQRSRDETKKALSIDFYGPDLELWSVLPQSEGAT